MSSATYFAPDGLNYVPKPCVRLVGDDGRPLRAAADVLEAILRWARSRPVVVVRDAELAQALESLGRPHSRRFVQKGLQALERAGLIARSRFEAPTRWGVEIVRQITLLFRVAGSAKIARKSKSGGGIGAKKFGPPCAQGGAGAAPPGALSLEDSREQEKENKAGAADAGGGTPSSSPADPNPDAGGDAPETAEEAEALKAAAREHLKALVEATRSAPPSPQDDPPSPWRPRPRASVLSVAKLAEMASTGDAAGLAELAEMAARGDRAARDALNDLHRRERDAAAAERPQSRGRDSPGADPPPPDPPRRGVLGRLFGRG